MTDSQDDIDLVRHAQAGDDEALARLMSRYRHRLVKMVQLRINRQLQGRIDASDVVQDAFLEATRVLDRFLDNPSLPFYLWIRKLTEEKLIQAHRFHLGTQGRAAAREVSLHRNNLPGVTSESIAAQLIGRAPTPSREVIGAETKMQLQHALDSMQPIDREVLVLRHFEHLSGPETAQVLGIQHETVKKRYIRALERLRSILHELKGSK